MLEVTVDADAKVTLSVTTMTAVPEGFSVLTFGAAARVEETEGGGLYVVQDREGNPR